MGIQRRSFLKNSLVAGFGGLLFNDATAEGGKVSRKISSLGSSTPSVVKKIIIGGGGLSGLCCAYELMMKGHEVVVLDMAGRYGGAVLTVHDGLADGLYADFGAENITKPGYEHYWRYIDQFKLPVVPYMHRENRLSRVNDKWLTGKELSDTRMQKINELGGYNARERKFVSSNEDANLQYLYLQPYFEKFKSEYQPFGVGMDSLENIPVSDIYKKEGASRAALELLGGDKSSALYTIWQAYIMHKRGYGYGYELFRLKGGNQVLPDAFAKALGQRVMLDCRITEVQHAKTGVTVKFKEGGEDKIMSADFFVSCLRPQALKNITITPRLPDEKYFTLDNVAFEKTTRIIFQAKSQFWLKDDLPSINLTFNDPSLRTIWRVAEEVDTHRVCLMAKAPGGTNPMRALETFKKLYPGQRSNISIEQTLVKDWAADPYSGGCERFGFSALGTLSKFWPHLMTPHGRIHFAGGHTDNRSWGMEAATNSANRAAAEIDQA